MTLQQIDYTYDGVGNITRMDQTEPSCGGLGGTYRNDYTYDYQYRLTQAECNAVAFRNQSKYTTMRGFLFAEEWANYNG